MTSKTFFNAHHAPIGSFASFTFGCKGPRGGLGIELKGPANEDLFIGLEDRGHPSHYQALPFYGHTVANAEESADYDVEGLGDFQVAPAISPFNDGSISRTFGPTIDEWRAGDLTFRVISPVRDVPDPSSPDPGDLKRALTPAILVELVIDNSTCPRPRKAFFGYAGSATSVGMRSWKQGNVTGIAQGTATCVATDDPWVYAGLAWQPEVILDPKHPSNLEFLLGSLGLLVGIVPAHETKTFRFTVCFFREGTATTGIPTRYYYRKFFDRIEEVAAYSLANFDALKTRADRVNTDLLTGLTPARQFMLSHAIRSYFGATQLLETADGSPLWVVNEGEYRMMNTFDLTIDQAFLELALNPWTVRNELDLFVSRYSYEDEVHFPGDPQAYPGGLVFTHDMGIANTFSRPGYSGYEQAGLRGVFSYMSCEELVNWILTASLYQHHTQDHGWAKANQSTFVAVAKSLMNRDHPDAHQRNGVMSLDSSRCQGGAEITTYDSLDTSLGQARENLYLAVKCWAAYILLEPTLTSLGELGLAAEMASQAEKCAATVCASADADGFLPALIGGDALARIIPAIEGLVYPVLAGAGACIQTGGKYAEFREVLAKHLDLALGTGLCRFSDGGWRLSSTSRNSWLSKIYLCQFIAEQILGRPQDSDADLAHQAWLLDDDNAYYAWSDQMVEGKACGSRYYPRGVTSILWLLQKGQTDLHELHSPLVGAGHR